MLYFRLEKGTVMRILDSKDPGDQEVAKAGPLLLDHLSVTSRKRFENVCKGLESLGIPYKRDPTLVRVRSPQNKASDSKSFMIMIIIIIISSASSCRVWITMEKPFLNL